MCQAPPQPSERNVPLGWKQWLDELREDNKHMLIKLQSSTFFTLFMMASAVNLYIISNKYLHFLPFSDESILQFAEIMFLVQLHQYHLFIKNYVEDLYRLQDQQAVAPPKPNQAQRGGGWLARIRGFFYVGLPFRKFLSIIPGSLSVFLVALTYLWIIRILYKH